MGDFAGCVHSSAVWVGLSKGSCGCQVCPLCGTVEGSLQSLAGEERTVQYRLFVLSGVVQSQRAPGCSEEWVPPALASTSVTSLVSPELTSASRRGLDLPSLGFLMGWMVARIVVLYPAEAQVRCPALLQSRVFSTR